MKYDPKIARQKTKKTYLEILKVHNKEVPIANLLAYFFRPNESHGLGDLFLRSLLKSNYLEYNGKEWISSQTIDDCHLDILTIAGNEVAVTLEEPTEENNKRIDILITVGNKLVIGIEFKINHDLDNPLEEYIAYINSKFKEYENKVFLILTPFQKEPDGKAKAHLTYPKDPKDVFKMIILNKMIDNVNKMIDNVYLEQSSSLHESAIIIQDFMQTIENRRIFYHRSLVKAQIIKTLNEKKLQCVENTKYKFLFVRQKNIDIKIRITNSGIQLEKWEEKNKIMDKIVEYDSDLSLLKEIIKNMLSL